MQVYAATLRNSYAISPNATVRSPRSSSRTSRFRMRTSIRIERAANGLALCGIVPGDRVALLVPNIPEFVIAYYAVLRCGGIVVPINVLYNAEEIAYIALVTSRRFVIPPARRDPPRALC